MKNLILAIAFISIGLSAQAQTQKIGYINSLELLSVMPEIKKADKDVEAYRKTFIDQLESMNKEYEQKVKAFQASEKTLSEPIKEIKIKEIQDLEKRIVDLNQNAEEKVSKKREDLYAPALEKANKAIQDVGKEKGFSYIMDSSTGALLFATDADNVIDAVKAKLGIKDTPAPAPKK